MLKAMMVEMLVAARTAWKGRGGTYAAGLVLVTMLVVYVEADGRRTLLQASGWNGCLLAESRVIVE